ncbi:MAG: Efflux ABC transporter, ATP-binding protein, partial [uncultured Lysobacter sp.]
DRRACSAVRQDRDAVRRCGSGGAQGLRRDPQTRPVRPVRRHHEGDLRM